ncbi:MAG: hypothetical protein JNM09_13755 [Blastocatellia bacterium]|nr:hypothetical protein [Blastocatellia bacterium]
MPLADFQSAIGTMIAVAATGNPLSDEIRTSLDSLQLTDTEKAWVQAMPQTRGFNVSCAIQRWWRETRMRDLAKLTIQTLGPECADQMIAAYLQQNICTSLFFLPETLAFLGFVAERSDHPHHHAIAQFERALLQAQEAARQMGNSNPTTTLIEFYAPPEAILAAVLQGGALPEPTVEPFFVLVSSALPHLWRPVAAEDLPHQTHVKTA